MIFSHKEGLGPAVFTNFLINSFSRGLRMSCSATGDTDFLQLFLPGKGGGQMNLDFPGLLYESGSDLNDFAPYGIELGRSPLCTF